MANNDPLTSLFEFAQANVRGASHSRYNLNNQDALSAIATENFIVNIVSDGASETETAEGKRIKSSCEVGSQIAANMAANLIAEQLNQYFDFFSNASEKEFVKAISQLLDYVEKTMQAQIMVLAQQMSHSLSETIFKYFMFTLNGSITTPSYSAFFAIGDGVYGINGEVFEIGPFPENKPPLLGYSLLSTDHDPELLSFGINAIIPTKDLHYWFVASDGLTYFINAQEEKIPGKNQEVGPVEQFWFDDKYYKNKFALNSLFSQCAKPHQRIIYDEGRVDKTGAILLDDTAAIFVRRIP